MSARTIALVVLASLLTVACNKSDDTSSSEGIRAVVSLQGAGATFPYPLYSKWSAEYNKAHPNVQINYQSIGSGGGIRQITARTVDFGASDVPLTASEAARAQGKLQHLPMTIGAVALAYNLPSLGKELRLDPMTVFDIFRGKITRWNDARITSTNPGVSLPEKGISVVFRSDGSGTNAVFTNYLAKVDPVWTREVGVGKSVRWPVGLGAKGNEGVTGQIKSTPGAIGYVELAYAVNNHMPVVHLRNKSGRYVRPSVEAMTEAASGVMLPDSLHASITDSAAPDAYPIVSYTYILVYDNTQNQRKGRELLEFLWWAIHDGQKYAKPLGYAPLPARAVSQVESRLKHLKAGGKNVFAAGLG